MPPLLQFIHLHTYINMVEDHEENVFSTMGHSKKYLKVTTLEMLTHVYRHRMFIATSVILKTLSNLIVYQAT